MGNPAAVGISSDCPICMVVYDILTGAKGMGIHPNET